jgi:peptidoglycan/LPS O-acetylase OafA/YrhL
MKAWSKSRPYQRKVGANYIPTLDGIRAVAIILVIASHIFDRYKYPTIGLWVTLELLFFLL